jgi:putative colanic acid biosysnthesis UDP-glucose lipid carrier transferase
LSCASRAFVPRACARRHVRTIRCRVSQIANKISSIVIWRTLAARDSPLRLPLLTRATGMKSETFMASRESLALRVQVAPAAASAGGVRRVPLLREVHPPRAAQVTPAGPIGGELKRAFDVAAAAAGLVVLSPLLLLVGLMIRLESPGPALFMQRRGGYRGRTFLIWKFRTMRSMDDGRFVAQAGADDPRVTPLGRLLRRTNIDELPQLVNVLKGEMSLVGPRPHAVTHDRIFAGIASDYLKRQCARPGISGLAQVSGCRGETRDVESVCERVKHDLDYVKSWSFWLDIKIIAKTIMTERR